MREGNSKNLEKCEIFLEIFFSEVPPFIIKMEKYFFDKFSSFILYRKNIFMMANYSQLPLNKI